jgi:Mrp family chromosome partitioning ATPase
MPDPGFDSIRTTLQSALAAPFVVAITSTQSKDGKTTIATGTARAFARAGFETLVLDANPLSPGVGAALGLGELPVPPSLDAGALAAKSAGGLLQAASIASHKLAETGDAASVGKLAAALRSKYAVTIVDLAELFYGPFCVAWSSASDGVVIAARYARVADDEDRRLVATLERANALVVGCVPTSFPAR